MAFSKFKFSHTLPCVLCDDTSSAAAAICSGCEQDLPQAKLRCSRCAIPLALETAFADDFPGHFLCGQCSVTAAPHNRCFSAYNYEFPIRELITGLKFQQNLVYGRTLGCLLGKCLYQHYQQTAKSNGITLAQQLPQAVIPVPLAPQRLRRRGYNQAKLIAQYALQHLTSLFPADIGAGHFDFAEPKLLLNACKKVAHTPPQTELSAQQRKRDLRFAFQAEPAICGHFKSVALVDDVYTTGSTLRALAAVLKQQGIENIDFWCVARTV